MDLSRDLFPACGWLDSSREARFRTHFSRTSQVALVGRTVFQYESADGAFFFLERLNTKALLALPRPFLSFFPFFRVTSVTKQF